MFVDTLAALKALAPGVADGVELLGYYARNDGGGGLFCWDGTSTATDNGGSIVQPNAGGTGRWMRLANREFTPEMFGAKSDGTNGRTFIQAAIDALSAVGGGTLRLPNRQYTIGGRAADNLCVLNPRSNVNIEGTGERSELRLADNTNVADALITASFSGTTMTVTATTGPIIANQFISHPSLAPVTRVVTQLGGTPNGVGTYTVTTTNTLASTAVKGTNRFVDIFGCYTPNRLDFATFRNFYVNYNGANNCAGGTIWTFNGVVTIQEGSNIVFETVRLRNNSGSNTFVIGYLTTEPTVSNVFITNCTFGNDGDRINAAAVDYSTIFAQAIGCQIIGNQMSGGPSLNGAAFEVYGRNITIANNNVRDYFNTANIVAISGTTTANVSFVANNILDCNVGVTLWALTATCKLYGINISDNTFRSTLTGAAGAYMVNGIGQVHVSADLRNILIDGNIFQQFAADTTKTTAGVSLQSFYTAKISNNVIYGTAGPGIHIANALVGGTLDITDNQLINTGYTTTTALKSGIKVDASATVSTLSIRGNAINPLGGYTLTYGIQNALAASSGLIRDNLIFSATTPISNTGAGVVSIPNSPPAFQATRGGTNQTGIAPATFTKVQFNSAEFNVGGYYNSTTNYRFTPLVAGKYLVNCQLSLLSVPPGVVVMAELRKNGNPYKRGRIIQGSATDVAGVALGCLVDLNGSTDYIEFFVYHENGSALDLRGIITTETYASAVWVST